MVAVVQIVHPVRHVMERMYQNVEPVNIGVQINSVEVVKIFTEEGLIMMQNVCHVVPVK